MNVDQKLNQKLIVLSAMHSEICETIASINHIYGVSMLILIASAFLTITTCVLFIYFRMTGQTIPKFFSSSRSLLLTFWILCETAIKCIYIVYTSWQTRLAAHRMGGQLHRIANTVNQCWCYHTVIWVSNLGSSLVQLGVKQS